MITAAGASFGSVLQQTNIADRIGSLATEFNISGLVILPMAFFVTAIVRTAQGSATVSMITAVGIFASMAEGLPFHPVYLAMAIGCGSKPFDSKSRSNPAYPARKKISEYVKNAPLDVTFLEIVDFVANLGDFEVSNRWEIVN